MTSNIYVNHFSKDTCLKPQKEVQFITQCQAIITPVTTPLYNRIYNYGMRLLRQLFATQDTYLFLELTNITITTNWKTCALPIWSTFRSFTNVLTWLFHQTS